MMNISSATSAAPTQIPMMVLRARGLEVGGAVGGRGEFITCDTCRITNTMGHSITVDLLAMMVHDTCMLNYRSGHA